MLTQEKLKELLDYCPETGVFRWRVSRKGVTAGSVAGGLTKGYIHIGVDCRRYFAHRLAWLYMHGIWPTKGIDHRDMNKSNNRFLNLREATMVENLRNVGLQSHNTSGHKGVSFPTPSGRFRARAKINGKTIHLGYFLTAELASEAYQAFAATNHGEFYRGAY